MMKTVLLSIAGTVSATVLWRAIPGSLLGSKQGAACDCTWFCACSTHSDQLDRLDEEIACSEASGYRQHQGERNGHPLH